MPFRNTLGARRSAPQAITICLARVASVLAFVLLPTTLTPVMAGVGQPVQAVARDAAAMGGSVLVRAGSGNFSVQEIVAPGGGLVREYVGPSGMVFAVSWSGPTMPDLKALLASYYPRFALQAQASERGSKVLAIQCSDFVLRILKLPRGLAGAAYVPQLMPSGVTAAQLK
jgi:predicted methyltransferase